MKLTSLEMETIIRFDEETHIADIYTSSKRVAKKLMEELKVVGRTKCGKATTSWSFSVPDYAVIIKPEKKAVRLGVKK